MMKPRNLLLFSLMLTLFVTGSIAQERTWVLQRGTVTSVEEVIAQYSKIFSRITPELPSVSRMLYKDQDGNRWILRTQVLADDSGTFSLKLLASSEVLTINIVANSHITYSLGGSECTRIIADDLAAGGVPASVRSTCLAMLAGSSQGFQTALRDLADVGQSHSMALATFSILLAEVFYTDLLDETLAPGDQVPGLVPNFNPHTMPPSTFEAEFGGAYYE